ncbi:MAG: PilN domain-containing protein [Thermoanaerobaculia bacterium]
MRLNLASQPFMNSRPVRRLVLVLWCLGAVLTVANLFFYTRHLSGQQARRDRLVRLAEQEGRENERLAELEEQLAGFDIDWQNRQVEFLNLRIAERVFPWSQLFDRLTEAMPRAVRLTRLRPDIRTRTGDSGREEIVRLDIRAEARNEEAMLNFVGRLFKHPAFRNPNLASENRRAKSNITEFDLSATYLPARAAPSAKPPPAARPAPAAAPAAPAGEVRNKEAKQ